MADDHNALTNKILLMRAANRSKAQSWLSVVSLPESDNVELQNQADELADIQVDDENAGIGVSKKGISEENQLSNRHLSAANDALRRKLLGKEAYSRYQQTDKGRADASKPKHARTKKPVEDDSDEEEKGRSARSGRVEQNRQKKTIYEARVDPNVAVMSESSARDKSSSKKRPGSYLDELLAQRSSKKKTKRKAEDD